MILNEALETETFQILSNKLNNLTYEIDKKNTERKIMSIQDNSHFCLILVNII